jgi:hypothetical protein
MDTKSAKQKGRKLQQTVRDKIIRAFKEFGVLPEDVKSCIMGDSGEDIQLSPFARSFLPISLECKSYKSFAVYKHYEQAEKEASKEGYEPVVVLKANHKKPLVLIDLDYWLDLENTRVTAETLE